MPVVTVSRWKLNPNEAIQIARDAAPLIKQQGAQTVTFGRIQTGEHAGQVSIVCTYASYEELGRAMDKQRQDQQFQELYARALQAGELTARNIVIIEELN